MRILVPITGELTAPGRGNPDNPVRPVDITTLARRVSVELSDFSWRVLNYDFENGIAELEVSFEKRNIPIKFDGEGNPTEFRLETKGEFQQRRTQSEDALHAILRDHTIDELHRATGEPKLVRPFKVV